MLTVCPLDGGRGSPNVTAVSFSFLCFSAGDVLFVPYGTLYGRNKSPGKIMIVKTYFLNQLLLCFVQEVWIESACTFV